MGIYIKDSFDNDIQEEVEFLIDSCLMESVENPFEYVKWFYENALIYSARADGKVVAVVLARRHAVDDFSPWAHDENGDVLWISELAATSHEAIFHIYKQFISDCLSNGFSFPNVIMFNREKTVKRVHASPIIKFMQKFTKI